MSSSDTVAGPSHVTTVSRPQMRLKFILDVNNPQGSTFNAIGTSGTVMMVAGHVINNNYIYGSKAGQSPSSSFSLILIDSAGYQRASPTET